MTNLQPAREFLKQVIAWPKNDEAFVNLHWKFEPKEGHKPRVEYWSGRAVHTLDEAIKELEWALNADSTRDIYFCTSTQSETEVKTTKSGRTFNSPFRLGKNTVLKKLLALDVDVLVPSVKEDESKGYKNIDEATQAIKDFCAATSLPEPNEAVRSGAGLQVYWTLDTPQTREQWQILADALDEATRQHGLKCDSVVTVDASRILRIPGTINYKYDPPRPVELFMDPVDDYKFEDIDKALTP